MKILNKCCGASAKDGGVKIPSDEQARKQAEFIKALSDPARIRIIHALKGGELCVCDIMTMLGLPQTMVSHHCKILKVAGIVKDRKCGKWVHYSLVDKRVLDMLETLYPEG